MRNPRRLALVLALAAAGCVLLAGCARESPEHREVRLTAQRYLNALAHKDLEQIRERSTCVVAMQFIRGGNVLRIGPSKRVRLGALDSLSQAASDSDRAANLMWMRGKEGEREALFQTMRRAGLADVIYRNAIRAVHASNPDTLCGSDCWVETCALHMRIRYVGSPVGPERVDKEHVLRLLRAPGGKWIAFSLYTVEDDPRPAGV
jgi:hypothetical protein